MHKLPVGHWAKQKDEMQIKIWHNSTKCGAYSLLISKIALATCETNPLAILLLNVRLFFLCLYLKSNKIYVQILLKFTLFDHTIACKCKKHI